MKARISRLVPASSVVLYSLLAATTALGQITPDNTLGNESSVVTNLNINGIVIDLIEGGAIRDSNLFHSFSDFNVAEFAGAYFDNPAGVANILSRVTGPNVSNILGTLGVLGNANLFLINPNGIVFGPNSRLDVGGSFFGSTADSVLFEDGTVFSTKNPNEKPLLTINIPSGLQYGENSGSIRAQGISGFRSFFQGLGLRVQPGKTLALVGNDITLEGFFLEARAGRIELGSVAGPGMVSLTPKGQGWVLGYEGIENFRDIEILRSFISTSVEEENDLAALDSDSAISIRGSQLDIGRTSIVRANTFTSLPGGDISIDVHQLTLRDGANLSSNAFEEGKAGNVTVNASESVKVIDGLIEFGFPSNLSASSNGAGDGGDILINTDFFLLQNGGQVDTITRGEGDAGNLTVNASEIQVIGGQFNSDLSTQTQGIGKAGNLSITTGKLLVQDGGQVSAATFGDGNGGSLTVNASEVQVIGPEFLSSLSTQTQGTGKAGNLSITTGKLLIQDGSEVNAATFGDGDGGSLSVNASKVQVIGKSANGQSPSGLFVTASDSIGNAGDLSITTSELLVEDGGQVSASTFGEGNGGTLSVDATDSVQVIGRTADGRFPSALFTQTEGKGNARELKITTGELIVSDGAVVSAGTVGQGNGGNLTVNASESVQVIGTGTSADGEFPSGLFTEAQRTGKAGEFLKITTDKLIISDGAIVSARSIQQDSSAGEVKINANSIFLDNNSRITAETAGKKGNIILEARDIRLLDESNINTNAQNTDGGNIFIDTDTLVGLGNSDITANALKAKGDNVTIGEGGRVEINAKGIFGLEFRDDLTPDNDITSTSKRGSSFNGEVILNISQVDPTSGLNELPGILVDAEAILANDLCGFENDRIAGGSSFTITGKGGLPPTPEDPVINAHRTVRWRSRPRLPSTRKPLQAQASVRPRQDKKVIIEAQGWVVAKDGTIILTAQPFNGTPVEQIFPNLDCHAGRGNREQGTGNREE
ncbi:filamentous hemagglutinin N-terminal domain-containing protein [Moorena producens]|uniref:two-partner secretion domain-containing protein n=1 Tax=Moorena producens TaxID=1155739 RepID=UPI003C76C75F